MTDLIERIHRLGEKLSGRLSMPGDDRYTAAAAMIVGCVLTIATLLPLMAASGVAKAGPAIAERRYWPIEARPVDQPPPSAFATAVAPLMGGRSQAEPAKRCTYQGGPKSSHWTCQ